jgi:hypothetical protein
MTRLAKFRQLPVQDRRLLITSMCLLGAIGLGIKVLPFQALRRFLDRVSSPTPQPYGIDRPSIQKIAWAIGVISQYLPGVRTCLTQALAAYVLLRRCSHAADLRIGVARCGEGQLQAHAWVENEGRIVIGGIKDLSRYTPMPPLQGNGL